MLTTDEARLQRARRDASRLGYRVTTHRGGYMLADHSDSATGVLVAGPDFELTLDDVEAWLSAEAARRISAA